MEFSVVQVVVFDNVGDTLYRMIWPGKKLSENYPELEVINVNAYSNERLKLFEEADISILFHPQDSNLIPLMQKRKERNKPTLVEFGDNFYCPPPSSPIFKEWSSPMLWSTYEYFIKEADGIIVPSTQLVNLFRKKISPNLKIDIIPNLFNNECFNR